MSEEILRGAGGGATHVAKVTGHLSALSNNLSDILVVAAGGGGSAVRIVDDVETDKAKGGHGGGYIGGNPFLNNVEIPNKGGTQSSGYDFGQGQEKDASTGGGGAGLYGGKNQDDEWGFQYTGEIQTFTAPRTGIYKLETWGAQGGNASDGTLTARGGYGAYAVGEVSLTQGETLYIGVGGQNGFNGGGNFNGFEYDYEDIKLNNDLTDIVSFSTWDFNNSGIKQYWKTKYLLVWGNNVSPQTVSYANGIYSINSGRNNMFGFPIKSGKKFKISMEVNVSYIRTNFGIGAYAINDDVATELTALSRTVYTSSDVGNWKEIEAIYDSSDICYIALYSDDPKTIQFRNVKVYADETIN